MKRRILLVDDEVAVLLTMKAVLEISGFEVETAASAREGISRLHTHEYHMIITDMRMESDQAGRDVVQAARTAPYHPAVALLTAFPVDEADWQQLGAHQLLLKPMHTRVLLQQIEQLFETRDRRLASLTASAAPKKQAPAKTSTKKAAKKATKSAKSGDSVEKTATVKKAPKKTPAKKPKKTAAKKVVAKKVVAKKAVTKKTAAKKPVAKPIRPGRKAGR